MQSRGHVAARVGPSGTATAVEVAIDGALGLGQLADDRIEGTARVPAARLPSKIAIASTGDAMTVRKSPRGRWMIDVQISMPDGSLTRIRKVSPVQTKRGAEAYERELRQAVLAGTYGGQEDEHRDEDDEPIPTLAEMWPGFIAFQASSANKRPNRRRTVMEAERVFKAYLEPLIGNVRVDKITPRCPRK